MHVQKKHSLARLQDLIPTLAGIIHLLLYILHQPNCKVGIKSCRRAREWFICTCIYYYSLLLLLCHTQQHTQ